VSDLPQVVQKALESVGYGRKDIQVQTRFSVTLAGSSGSGRQSFVTLIDLGTDRFETHMGSWGGPNMFNKNNAVDNDTREHLLPRNGAALVGSRGGGQPVWAQLYIPAGMTERILPAKQADVTDVERAVLGAYKSLKSGQYRQDSLKRAGCTDAILDSLVKRGLLKRARNGATQITTEGKNLAGDYAF
jgi:hypothetical protein